MGRADWDWRRGVYGAHSEPLAQLFAVPAAVASPGVRRRRSRQYPTMPPRAPTRRRPVTSPVPAASSLSGHPATPDGMSGSPVSPSRMTETPARRLLPRRAEPARSPGRGAASAPDSPVRKPPERQQRRADAGRGSREPHKKTQTEDLGIHPLSGPAHAME